MELVVAFSALLEALLYGFSKNITYIYLAIADFSVSFFIVAETPKFKAVAAIVSVVALSVSFYFVYNAYITFGAYIADYGFMLLRLVILAVISLTTFLLNEKQEGRTVNG